MTGQDRNVYSFNRAQWAGLLLGLVVAGAGAYFATDGEQRIFTLILGALLVLLAVIDARRFILPNELNFALALTGGIMIWRLVPDQWLAHVIGGVIGYAALVSVEVVFRKLRGVDGLGRGDAKLLGAIGLWTGWIGLPSILLVGSGAGLLYGGALALTGRPMREAPIPFGPFLALGGWIVWLAGPLRLAL